MDKPVVPTTPDPAIFVIDDDAAVREGIRRLLLSLSLPVRLFESAEAFISTLSPTTRGCIILDIRLPGMTGIQLQEYLLAQHYHLPVIVVTAHDDDATRHASTALGTIAYLRKPFDRRDLLKHVQAAFRSLDSSREDHEREV